MVRLSILAAILVSVWGSYTFSQAANIYTFGPDIRITDAPPDEIGTSSLFFSSGQHFTAFRGDTVYVVWWESRTSFPPTGNHVFLAKSTDAGQTFGPAKRVNDIPAGFNPSMRVDSSGIIYVAYERQGDIYFTKSTDGGTSFTASVLVVDAAGLDSLQQYPSIAVNNKGQILIAWFDERTSPRTVFAAASSDSGQTFGPNVRVCDVCNSPTDGFDVAADDYGHLYIVMDWWSSPKGPLYLLRSGDSGQTFQLQDLVTDFPMDATTAIAINPSIAIGDGLVGVVWEDYRNSQQPTIRFSLSSDAGRSFSPSVRVDTGYSEADCVGGSRPSLTTNKEMFYVAWEDGRVNPSDSGCNENIFLSYSLDQGGSFVTELRGSNVYYFKIRPSVAVNEQGKAFVAWIDDRDDPIFDEVWRIYGAVATPHFVKGDLNLDGLLSPADAVFELNAVFLAQAFPAPFENADGNCDLELTAADVVLHLNATFLGEGFPCI